MQSDRPIHMIITEISSTAAQLTNRSNIIFLFIFTFFAMYTLHLLVVYLFPIFHGV